MLTRPDAQVVFVDTPGIHKPRTTMGERLNATAEAASSGVDVVCLVIDATAPVGKGDRFVAGRVPENAICVVNKVDLAGREEVLLQLARAAQFELAEYFPVSARTGEGVVELVEAIVARLPEGPQYYPDEMITDLPTTCGWPSWFASSCWPSCARSCPTRSPAGSPSTSGLASGWRSWSSGTPRRASSSARAGRC